MAVTSEEELERLGSKISSHQNESSSVPAAAASMDVDSDEESSAQQPSSSSSQTSSSDSIPLTGDRIVFLLDLMRDIGAYVESKDFEQGLPITNFERYHELWSMDDGEDGEGEEEEEEEEEEDED
jgi:hypothetical protein